MIRPVFLWADLFLWVIFVVISVILFFDVKNRVGRDKWLLVFRRPIASASFLVLLFYVFIALLDSIHFCNISEESKNQQCSVGVRSILDVFLDPLRSSFEKTYSSPFSAYAWSKESVENSEGRIVRVFPRLLHGGAHLLNPEDELLADIFYRVVKGLGGAVAVFLFVIGLIKLLFYCFNCGNLDLSWRAAMFVFFVMSFVVSALIQLAPYYHVFGTDQVGRDVLYITIKSIRTGVAIGLITTLVTFPIAVLLGVSAGYFGGLVDDVIQYVYITLHCVPGVLLIVAIVMMLDVYINNNTAVYATPESRADIKLVSLCFILGITSWTSLCRLLRAETLKLRELDYVRAASAFGVRSYMILLRHVLPNLTHLIIISLVIDFSGLVLAESILSYVGVGVDPNMESWGNMINGARLELARVPVIWWPLFAAFLSMSVLVLFANLFADAVREVMNPGLTEQ